VLCVYGAARSARAEPKDGGSHLPNRIGADMKIESSAFQSQGEIPRKYTCEGEDVSPPLGWSELPAETKTLALIVDDPDAPDPKAPKTTWVHWVVFNIPAIAPGLPEAAELPAGAADGINDWKRTGYGGPCPPIGRHRYFFKLYALDTALELTRPSKAQLEQAIEGHVLAQAELVGTYQKQGKAAR
jgi:Raf kinase inhibitor-like YbhB/YbcL family protein